MKIIYIFLLTSIFTVANAKVTVDVKESQFKWHGTKKLGGGHYGKIFLKSASINVNKDKFISAKITMDMTSFTADDLSGFLQKKFLSHVKSADFFEVDKYPTSTLEIKKYVENSHIEGNLTIKGKTMPVKVKFKQKGNTFTGTLKFDRTKFGIVYGSGNFFKELIADKIINDEVKVDFKVVVKQ
jgi:polyisoprenoid-binding protein YceI